MSVILDALKRVQEENRRRGVDPAVLAEQAPERAAAPLGEQGPAPVADSVPEMTEPFGAELIPEQRQLSPLAWVAIIALCSTAVISAALWWFQPDFTGSQVNDGRPLLTRFDGTTAGNARVRSQEAAVSQEEVSEATAPVDMTPSDAARVDPERTEATATQTSPEAGTNSMDDMSDLSAGLPSGASDANERVSVPDNGIDLRVREGTAPAANSAASSGDADPGFSLTSSNSGATEARAEEPVAASRRPATGNNPFASRESEPEPPARNETSLVDPTVRSAFERGLRLQKAGDLGGAEDAYLRALKLDPYNARINANLAVLYENQGRLQLAEQHLRDAINVEPQSATAHNNLGVVLYRMGNYDGALTEFNRTLALNPEQLDAYTNKGLIFMRWGQYEDAQRAFRQVLALDPENALAHYNLGLVYEEMEEWSLAIDSYYRFLDVGGAAHPEIVQYVGQRLPWIEARLSDGNGR